MPDACAVNVSRPDPSTFQENTPQADVALYAVAALKKIPERSVVLVGAVRGGAGVRYGAVVAVKLADMAGANMETLTHHAVDILAAENAARVFAFVFPPCGAAREVKIRGHITSACAEKSLPIEWLPLGEALLAQLHEPGGGDGMISHFSRALGLEEPRDDELSFPEVDENARRRARRATLIARDGRLTRSPYETAMWRVEVFGNWLDALEITARGETPLPCVLGRIQALIEDGLGLDAVLVSVMCGNEAAWRLLCGYDRPECHEGQAPAPHVPDGLGIPDLSLVERVVALLLHVAAHQPAGLRGQACAVIAWLHWCLGDGPQAEAFFEVANRDAPQDRLTRLVRGAVTRRIPAATAPRVRRWNKDAKSRVADVSFARSTARTQ